MNHIEISLDRDVSKDFFFLFVLRFYFPKNGMANIYGILFIIKTFDTQRVGTRIEQYSIGPSTSVVSDEILILDSSTITISIN